MNERGQVEIEAVVSIGIMLFFFVAVLTMSLFREEEARFLERQASALAECRKISETIGFFSSSRGEDEIFFESETDFNVSATTIYVGEFFCGFFGDVAPANLSRGAIRVFEQGGLVTLENA